jgi:hypothetical protein
MPTTLRGASGGTPPRPRAGVHRHAGRKHDAHRARRGQDQVDGIVPNDDEWKVLLGCYTSVGMAWVHERISNFGSIVATQHEGVLCYVVRSFSDFMCPHMGNRSNDYFD